MLQSLAADVLQPFGAMRPEVALLRLLAALVLGGVIGMEREIAHRPAGLRTHMMLALASALFTIVTLEMMASPLIVADQAKADPLRLIEAVTAGVAFLAAGTIFTSRGSVKGLTTGAGMWLAGAIGLACGLGLLALAAMATVLALCVLWLVARIAPDHGETPSSSAGAPGAGHPPGGHSADRADGA